MMAHLKHRTTSLTNPGGNFRPTGTTKVGISRWPTDMRNTIAGNGRKNSRVLFTNPSQTMPMEMTSSGSNTICQQTKLGSTLAKRLLDLMPWLLTQPIAAIRKPVVDLNNPVVLPREQINKPGIKNTKV